MNFEAAICSELYEVRFLNKGKAYQLLQVFVSTGAVSLIFIFLEFLEE